MVPGDALAHMTAKAERSLRVIFGGSGSGGSPLTGPSRQALCSEPRPSPACRSTSLRSFPTAPSALDSADHLRPPSVHVHRLLRFCASPKSLLGRQTPATPSPHRPANASVSSMANEISDALKPFEDLWQIPPPPFPKGPYSPEASLRPDIACVTFALHVFLASHMHQSEDFCLKYDSKM